MGCPNVISKEKDGLLRFFVYYRELNAVAVHDSYLTPRMDEGIDSHGDALIFSTSDAIHGYWQVEIEQAKHDKTALTLHHRWYWLSCIPFGRRNAPGIFQRSMNVIFHQFNCSVPW